MALHAHILRALLCVLLLAATAQAQATGEEDPRRPTPTVLYLHYNGTTLVPMSTQEPSGAVRSSSEMTLSCLDGLGVPGAPRGNNHTFRGFPVVAPDTSGQNTRATATEVLLDVRPMTLVWYLEGGAGAPVDVVVRGSLIEGDIPMPGAPDDPADAEDLLAQGQSDPATLTPLTVEDHPHVTHEEVGGRDVYRFEVPLDLQQQKLPGGQSPFHLLVHVFMDFPACDAPDEADDPYMTGGELRVHSSGDRRPRLEFTVLNPIQMYPLQVHSLDDGVFWVRGFANTPWGGHDVDASSVQLTVEGPDLRVLPSEKMVGQQMDHGPPRPQPLVFSWILTYEGGGPPTGSYSLTVQARSHQGPATGNATAELVFDPVSKQSISGPPPLLSLLVAAVGRRLLRPRT